MASLGLPKETSSLCNWSVDNRVSGKRTLEREGVFAMADLGEGGWVGCPVSPR